MTISVFIETVAGIWPERVAVESLDGSASTYAELDREAKEVALELGGDGGVVLYMGLNRPSFAPLLFGCGRAGRPLCAVSFRTGPEDLEHYLAEADPGTLLVEERYLPAVEAALASRDSRRTAYAADPGLARIDVERRDPGSKRFADAAAIVFTSGSTALPKPIALRHDNLLGYVLTAVDPGSAGPDEAFLWSMPTYHIAGVTNVLSSVFAGRRLVVLPQFGAAEWVDAVAASAATHGVIVPTMLKRVCDELEGGGAERVATLRNLAYGGAAASPQLIERALDLFGDGVDLVNAYGLTETSSTISVLGPEEHRAARAAAPGDAAKERLRSAGRPAPGVEVAVVDEDLELLPAGERGRIVVRGAQVIREALTPGREGWFDTGDDGYFDSEGYLFVLGRGEQTIIRGGENIAALEIELAIAAHPGAVEAAVVGVEDLEWGETIAAMVVPAAAAELDEGELRTWLRGQVAGFKVPSTVAFVPALPRNDLGKVDRRAVRAHFAAPDDAELAASRGHGGEGR